MNEDEDGDGKRVNSLVDDDDDYLPFIVTFCTTSHGANLHKIYYNKGIRIVVINNGDYKIFM